MRVWILDTAMPLALGRPRQRLAAALRDWFDARSGSTRHITIDLRGTEAASWLRRARGDMVLPLARVARGARTGEGRLPPAPEPRWLTPGRRRRLAAMLAHERPDLIVVGDPLLAPLAPVLAAAHCPLRLIDSGGAAWHRLLARRVGSAAAAAAHLRTADAIEAATAAFADLTQLPPLRGPGLVFAPDERYFDKRPSVVALATGDAEADRAALAALAGMLAECRAAGLTAPEPVLIGFDAEAARSIPGAVTPDDWMHLEGLVGAARALVLPILTPDLAAVAEAALTLGTPVVTGPAESLLSGLAAAPGTHAAGSAQMTLALARLVDPDITGAEDWRAIAAAARDRAARASRVMAEIAGLAEAPLRPPPARTRRIPPALGRPEVLWNPLSRMLLVRLRYRRDAGVEEVRLLARQGTELIRLMPSQSARRLDPVPVEGGVVTALEDLGGGLLIELHDAASCLQAIPVETSAFRHLEAEIAWLHRDGVMLRGAFWLSAAAAQAAGYAIESGGARVDLDEAHPIPMPETGGHALRFEVPLDLTLRTPVLIEGRRPGPYRSAAPLLQRPLVPTPELLADPPPEPPDLAALRDRHRGQRAWIIGNGPSVRPEDLAAIPEADVKFCFNRFYLSYGLHPLRETYVVSADTLMIADFGQEMIDRSAGLALFCLGREHAGNLRGPHVLLPPFDGALPLFSMEPAAYVGVGGSSVVVALQLAHYMGLRDVLLYGIDYSFSMTLVRDPRFPFPISYDDGNHFIPSYRSAKPWCPPTWRDISAGFLNARVAYETTGGRVRNATRGGRLEVFERVDFDRAVAERPGAPGAGAEPHPRGEPSGAAAGEARRRALR
jgi:hypothetical protein